MIIFEPPYALAGSTGGVPVWIGVSGGPNWGGCDIWVSEDNATYQQIGRITEAARWGKLSAALPAASASPDTTHTLAVDLRQSGGQLTSAGQSGAAALSTLAYVGGELLSYGSATLTGPSQYNLAYLVRGAYGTTMAAHPAGAPFLRLDQAIFEYTASASLIGRTLYVKFVSFNVFGNYGAQSLATVQPVYYTITGQGIGVPPAAIANVAAVLSVQGTMLQWTGVSDARPLDYEVREGPGWTSGLFVGRSTAPSYPAPGAGTYWVASRAQPVAGYSVYQASPASVVVTQSVVPRTLVLNTDQAASGFSGTMGGSAVRIATGTIELGGTANILAEANWLALGDLLFDGGVGSGTYTLAGETSLGRIQAAQIAINVTASAASINANFVTIANLLAVTDLMGSNVSAAATIQPQVRTAGANHTYGAWINFSQGQVSAQYIQIRLLLNSADPQVTMLMTGLSVTIDVAGQTLSGSAVPVPAAGLAISFATPFGATPSIAASIIGGTSGDGLTIATQSATGFSVQAQNGGAAVARTIDWIATGI